MINCICILYITLGWHHNGRYRVSNHETHKFLLNHLFRRRSKKASRLRVIGFCVGNSPVTGEFPAQMASNAGYVSIWWRHHDLQRNLCGCGSEGNILCALKNSMTLICLVSKWLILYLIHLNSLWLPMQISNALKYLTSQTSSIQISVDFVQIKYFPYSPLD